MASTSSEMDGNRKRKLDSVDNDKAKNVEYHVFQRQRSDLGTRVMRNPIVLGKIGEILPAKVLFTLRSTCREWNWSLVPQLRKKHKPLSLEVLTEYISSTPPRSSYIEVVRSSKNLLRAFPFSRYTFKCFFQHGAQAITITEPERKLAEILEATGSSMTSLSFWGDVTHSTLRKLIFDVTPGGVKELKLNLWSGEEMELDSRHEIVSLLPNLKKLAIFQDRPVHLPIVSQLLQKAIGLEHLEVNGSRSSFDIPLPFPIPILEALQDSVPHAQLTKLKTLKLAVLKTDKLQILVGLTRRKNHPLRLVSFSIGVTCDDDGNLDATVKLLNEFLAFQAPTLRWLKIDVAVALYHDVRSETPLRLSRMEHLHTLELVRSDEWRVRVAIVGEEEEGMSFAGNFPELKRFLYQVNDEDNEAVGTLVEDLARMFHPGVTELSLIGVRCDSMPAFGTAFPGVLRLVIDPKRRDINDEAYSMWTIWPALTSLSISAYFWDVDSFLTGVPSEQLPDLYHDLMSSKQVHLDILRSLQRKYKVHPGLTDLHHLRYLQVCLRGSCLPATNLSGCLALSLARQLEHISIRDVSGFDRDRDPSVGQHLNSEEFNWFLRHVLGPFAVIDI